MKTCSICTAEKSKPGKALEVDYCMICGIFHVNFGEERPRLYQQVEAQTRRWEQQRATVRA